MKLPADGVLRLGAATLPAGRRIAFDSPEKRSLRSPSASRGPVIWLTDEPVPEPGKVWWELSQACEGTGLVPFVAAMMPDELRLPRYTGPDVVSPEPTPEVDRLDPAGILAERWQENDPRSVPDDEEDDEEEEDWEVDEEELRYFEEETAPFSDGFPGLAPSVGESLDPARLQEGVARLRHPERIGLAVAERTADVLPLVRWLPANWIGGELRVVAVLRSWEERYGARLVAVEPGAVTVLAERPPHTHAVALRLAAEMSPFADEIHIGKRLALSAVSEIAERLVDAPVWRFWWD
jgi:hypothetical protein